MQIITSVAKEWERAAHIDYIESDGTTTECKLQQDWWVSGYSGKLPQFRYAKRTSSVCREEYGKKNFKYNFLVTTH